MNKKDLIRKIIEKEVWKAFRKAYPIGPDQPHSDAQKLLLKEVSDMVYGTFAKRIPIRDLEQIWKDTRE